MGIVRLHPVLPAPTTLAAYAEELDTGRYACPPHLSRLFDRLLDPAGDVRVLTVTGRGGVGKSAALREVCRRAERAGHGVVVLDARADDVLAVLDRLDAGGQVVLVDEADALGPAAAALGPAVAALPGETRVVVAGRTLPRRWLPGPLEALALQARLVALGPEEADELLVRWGVRDPDARRGIAERADGLPLALVVGARAWSAGEERHESVLAREVGEDLEARLGDAALDLIDHELLAVLVVAAGVDLPLLDDLFPGRAAELLRTLRSTSVVEPVGGRLVLHPSLAGLLAGRIWAEEPERASATVLRVAGHEHARAVAGESGALPRLAALVGDPGLRAGLGPTTLGRHYADRWRPSDAAPVREQLARRHPGVWPVVAPWLGEDARVVRRADGRPVALVAALSMDAAAAVGGPRERLVAPVVTHARRHGDADRAVLSAVQLAFDEEPEVAWVRNAAGLAQCGIGNPRSDHVNLIGDVPAERAVLEAYGYAEVTGLRRTLDGVPVTTWVADVGAGGLAGLLYAAVVAEQGGATGSGGDGDLLAALEAFHSDVALARLAPAGSSPANAGSSAAEQLRARVRARVDRTLATEPLLHDLVVRRYLTAGATHGSVMRATYLSRATYFRRLRRVRELLAAAS